MKSYNRDTYHNDGTLSSRYSEVLIFERKILWLSMIHFKTTKKSGTANMIILSIFYIMPSTINSVGAGVAQPV